MDLWARISAQVNCEHSGIQGFPSLVQLHHLLAQYSSDATQHLYTKFGLVNAVGTNKHTQNLVLVKGTRVK